MSELTTVQSFHQPSRSDASSSSLQQSPVVSHGCLLIPVIVAVGWYWTRQAAQKMARRVCRIDCCCGEDDSYSACADSYSLETTTTSMNENQFHSWQDVVRHNNDTVIDLSFRRVRWFKGWNNRHPKRKTTRRMKDTLGRISPSSSTPINQEENVSKRSVNQQFRVEIWHDIEGIELCEK